MNSLRVTVVCALILTPLSVDATPRGSAVADQALQRCRAADGEERPQQELWLSQGVDLAESAVAADEQDAEAHFAYFCNLAKRVRLQGIGFSAVRDIRRARRELDRALEIAPVDADLLAAKGALLLSLPRFLGGDVVESRELLLRAFIANPDNPAIRSYLKQALEVEDGH